MLLPCLRLVTWRTAVFCACSSLVMATGCAAEQPETDTRGVLNLFVSGPIGVRLEGLVYLISGDEAGVSAGALSAEGPVLKTFMAPSQHYSVAVTGLGIPQDGDGKDRLACEASQDFEIVELRTTEIDLDIKCEAVGTIPPKVVDTTCSVASMLVAPRIQHVGGTITAFADPFPADAPLRWTTPDNGIGRILSAGQGEDAEYAFECVTGGFTEIVVEVLDGDCTARASSAVVCMDEGQVIEEDIEVEEPQ